MPSFFKEFTTSIGLKKQDLYKQSINPNVVQKDGLTSFTPKFNNGSIGFVNIVPAKKVEIETNKSFQEIASVLKNAFDICE